LLRRTWSPVANPAQAGDPSRASCFRTSYMHECTDNIQTQISDCRCQMIEFRNWRVNQSSDVPGNLGYCASARETVALVLISLISRVLCHAANTVALPSAVMQACRLRLLSILINAACICIRSFRDGWASNQTSILNCYNKRYNYNK
jgi:hypothetical protein